VTANVRRSGVLLKLEIFENGNHGGAKKLNQLRLHEDVLSGRS